MSRKSTSPAVDGNSLGEAEQANAGVVHHALHSLTEADALLHEGVRRIMAASSDLPEASHPLEEALRLTETQAMATLEAVENGFSEIAAIRATHGGFIDDRLDRLELQFHTILASQQGQDLAGQRLKKTIHLLQAVEQRIRNAVEQLGPQLQSRPDAKTSPSTESAAPLNGVPAYAGPTFAQDDVDALLRDLGI
ncbi:MAG: protein phosphatase CheZ [Thiomonas sp.]|nr:protein phosphatase CheZ [Thiomonas sp.]